MSSAFLHKSMVASNNVSNSPFGKTGITHLGLLIISSNLFNSCIGKSGSSSSPISSSTIVSVVELSPLSSTFFNEMLFESPLGLANLFEASSVS